MIMRHAKSSWNNAALRDHDRPLNKRGLRDAPVMANYIADQGFNPEIIISSTALRAKTTAELFVEHHPQTDCDVSLLEDLYHAPPDVYINVLNQLTTKAKTVMLVGHNPGLEHLVQQLSGEYHSMPTSATAVFNVDIVNWSEFEDAIPSRIDLVDVWRPKELPI